MTLQDIEKFFIGSTKFVKSTSDTAVYKAPGEASFKTVDAGDTIGKVISVNEKGNWLNLRDDQYNPGGGYILTRDNLYTVNLTTEAPDNIASGVAREVPKAVNTVVKGIASGLNILLPGWLKIVLVLLVGLFIIMVLSNARNAKLI